MNNNLLRVIPYYSIQHQPIFAGHYLPSLTQYFTNNKKG